MAETKAAAKAAEEKVVKPVVETKETVTAVEAEAPKADAPKAEKKTKTAKTTKKTAAKSTAKKAAAKADADKAPAKKTTRTRKTAAKKAEAPKAEEVKAEAAPAVEEVKAEAAPAVEEAKVEAAPAVDEAKVETAPAAEEPAFRDHHPGRAGLFGQDPQKRRKGLSESGLPGDMAGRRYEGLLQRRKDCGGIPRRRGSRRARVRPDPDPGRGTERGRYRQVRHQPRPAHCRWNGGKRTLLVHDAGRPDQTEYRRRDRLPGGETDGETVHRRVQPGRRGYILHRLYGASAVHDAERQETPVFTENERYPGSRHIGAPARAV